MGRLRDSAALRRGVTGEESEGPHRAAEVGAGAGGEEGLDDVGVAAFDGRHQRAVRIDAAPRAVAFADVRMGAGLEHGVHEGQIAATCRQGEGRLVPHRAADQRHDGAPAKVRPALRILDILFAELWRPLLVVQQPPLLADFFPERSLLRLPRLNLPLVKQRSFLPLGAQFASEALQLRLGRVDLRVQPFRLLSLGDLRSVVVRGIGGRGRSGQQPLDRFGRARFHGVAQRRGLEGKRRSQEGPDHGVRRDRHDKKADRHAELLEGLHALHGLLVTVTS